MRVVHLLAFPVLLAMAAGASAQPQAKATLQVLELIPGQAQSVTYNPDFRRLEAKWSKVVAPFGGKDGLLTLKRQTGLDPSRLGSGPLVRVTFQAPGAPETWAWLLPAKDPKAVFEGLKATQKSGAWTWKVPAGRSISPSSVPVPVPLFGAAKGGYLVVASTEADLAAFKKPATTLAAELAPYRAWLESHDVSLVLTKAGVAEVSRAAGQSLKPAASGAKVSQEPAAASSKAASRLKAKLTRWTELASVSVHHVLFGLDVTEEGDLAFLAQALLSKDSPLSRELETLLPVTGQPLNGLASQEFALAFGTEGGMLFDVQSALIEDLDKTGKIQPATAARMQKALDAQNALTRSVAGTFSAPARGGALMSGLTTLIRVSDSKAYLAAMEESSQAQNAFLRELGHPEAIAFTRDSLPGVPSCSMTTRLAQTSEDPAAAQARMAMALVFGGDSFQLSLGALDDHQVLMVMGGPELLKARLDTVRKGPEGLAPSIAAVEPDLGRDHRFAFYLEPRGLRNLAEVVAGMFGGDKAGPLPAIPAVPAAGFTLSLDPAKVELRGSVRAETLKAAATLFKAIGSLVPANKGGDGAPEKESTPKK